MDSTLKSCQGPQSYRWHLAVSPIKAAERSDSQEGICLLLLTAGRYYIS